MLLNKPTEESIIKTWIYSLNPIPEFSNKVLGASIDDLETIAVRNVKESGSLNLKKLINLIKEYR